jgi:HlyD family secretion protein
VKVVSQASGVITKLNVKDGEKVLAGSVLAEIENPLSPEDAKYMKTYLHQLENALKQSAPYLPLPDTTYVSLGDLQTIVNALMKELIAYNLNASLKMDDMEINAILDKIKNQHELIAVNARIIAITKKEVENAKIKFDADEKLYKEAFLSKMDFLQSESAFRAKELTLEQLMQSSIVLKSELEALTLQHRQAEFNKINKNKNNIDGIHGAVRTIRGYVYGWQQKYNLIALKSGKVNFLQRLQAGIFLRGGEELFAITEPGGTYLGIAHIPTAGYGKVKTGQSVNVSLQNFPYYEYGVLKGKVIGISQFANADEYRVEISLPNGMMSSQKRLLNYTPEMAGEAEIITDDKRVIERLFDSISKALKRK